MTEALHRLSEILDELVESEEIVAREAARRARLLAEATTLQLERHRTEQHGEAMRSLVAEIGCALRVPEGTIVRQLNDAEVLVRRLPGTLALLGSGAIGYRHAQVMVRAVTGLPPEACPALEAAVLDHALVLTASRFDRVARQERERRHPESLDVRARAATAERSVTIEAAPDGMAWLTC
ncbi:MAG: DUF222 domain-containing protein, partial [Herbiconiux sp.]|nr:DUF222 domain-containing protein [Herbiconiux sp.]